MGETPEQSGEGQLQGDQGQPKEQGATAGDAKSAWNRRAQETGRSPDKAVRVYTGPDPKGDLYDMATPPPKIGDGQAKIIPQGDLGDLIPKREPPDSALRLRDHKASVPPEKRGKSANKDQVDMTFPAEVIRRSDAGLSNTEKAERARVAHPRDGVGFGFGKDKPTQAEVKRWHDGLSAEEKAALKAPNVTIHITATCSKPGDSNFNQDLSERRAKSMARILEKEYGIDRSRIDPVGLGEDPAHDNAPDVPDNQDDHQERVALIHFESKRAPEDKDQPQKKESPQESINRAKRILEQNPPKDKQVRKRLTALLDKLSDPKVNDAYIPGRVVVPQDQPGNETPPDQLAKHARSEVNRLMTLEHAIHKGKGKYEFKKPNDKLLSSRLERLDREILTGPREVNRRMAIQGVTASKWLVIVNNWIASKQEDSNSIMSVYGKREP